jgi:hypothetical protein
MSRPYLLHYARLLAKSRALTDHRTEATGPGRFRGLNPSRCPGAVRGQRRHPGACQQRAVAPLSPSQTYVHVISTSTTEASAERWSAAIMRAISKSKLIPID